VVQHTVSVAVHQGAPARDRRPALCGPQDGTGLSCSLSNVVVDQLKKA